MPDARIHWLIAGLLVLGSSGAQALQQTAVERLGFEPAGISALHEAIDKLVADGKMAGLSTLLARHGEVVDFHAVGMQDVKGNTPMGRGTIARLYSMTKPITAAAMMVLFDEGKLTLDDPVTKFIPEFGNLRVMTGMDAQGNLITVPVNRPPTIREIMSHTAGFGYGVQQTGSPVDQMFNDRHVLRSRNLQEMVEKIAEIPLKFQPGTSWAYSVSVDIQGRIIERLSGQRFGDFLTSRVLAPLKMVDTDFFVGPAKAGRLAKAYQLDAATSKLEEAAALRGSPLPDLLERPALESGGGGLVSTIDDFGRFCQMILNKGELDGVRVLSPKAVALIGTNVLSDSLMTKLTGGAVGFGLNVMLAMDPARISAPEGKGTISFAGAAGTWFWIDPANDLYFVGFVQRLDGNVSEPLGSLTRGLTYKALAWPDR